MDKQSNNSGLRFDELNRPLPLHLILSSRSGSFIREIPTDNVRLHETLMNGSEISFVVYKAKCLDENGDIDIRFWRKIKDLKLAYCKELDRFYELRVNLNESDSTVKSITAMSLGEAEASQCNLYGVEINTDVDIARDDYEPSVLYNAEDKSSSIIDRLFSKMPHYRIDKVDSRIANIQRTFRFDGKSVYDACQEIEKEIGCIFLFECKLGSGHKISRTVSVRDMLCTCDVCGARGDFGDVCETCGSTAIHRGYGNDTPIYISKDNLAENIEYNADVDSVKNCFRLSGGDDLMTAAIIAQNPNGSQYLWYITDEMREDMSDELRERLGAYDQNYAYYQNEYTVPTFVSGDIDLRQYYNGLVDTYSAYNDDLRRIMGADGTEDGPVVGYPAIMEAYYGTIDMELFLRSGLMPTVETASTNAELEAAKLTRTRLSPAAVSSLSNCTATTAANAVLGMARCLIRQSFSIRVNSSNYNTGTHTWTGNFMIKNYSDEEDTAVSPTIDVVINSDLEKYIRQKIDTVMCRDQDDPTDIVSLFSLGQRAFESNLKKYSLKLLEEFRSACQMCLDTMIQNGVSKSSDTAALKDAYNDIYLPYRDKMDAIESEIKLRDTEIAKVTALRDENGNILEDGLQSMLERIIGEIHRNVNFEEFVGEDLMREFASYRRDDSYENANYISDGLDNKELFRRADEFLTAAKYEIARAARVHHSIKATLSNLLQMKEFLPIIDDFRVGNRMRVMVDGRLYVLRLTAFEVDYVSFELPSVEFSDVTDAGSPIGDIADVLDNAKSISTSYNAVMHQAAAGKKSNDAMRDIAEHGLKLTTHIVGGAHNQEFLLDESGYLGRQYIPETESYSPEQIRIISNGIYITDDNWDTMKAALGKFQYYNPSAGHERVETGFGVIAEQLVGNMLLTNSAGIYNENGSVVIDENGMRIIVDVNDSGDRNKKAFAVQRKDKDGVAKTILGVDANGDLILEGKIDAASGTIGGFTIGLDALYSYDKSSYNDSKEGVYLGNDGIALGSAFKVTKAGKVTASDLDITGGSISIKDSNGTLQFSVNDQGHVSAGDLSITGGSISIGDAFSVTPEGVVTAKNFHVTGGTIQLGSYSGGTPIFNVDRYGTATLGNLIVTGGQISIGKDYYNNPVFNVDTNGVVNASSLNLSGGTISIGRDTSNNPIFDVQNNGGVTARSLDILGGSISISSNGKDTFVVTDEGKVTASDMHITGGSISIWNGNNQVFNVNERGDAFFGGTINASQIDGFVTSAQLENEIQSALGYAVDYGNLEKSLQQVYSDVNQAIKNAIGYAVDYNTFNNAINDVYGAIHGSTTGAIKDAIGYATSYNNATQSGSSTCPEYFTAGNLYVRKTGEYTPQITNEGNYIVKYDGRLYNIKNHTHDFELEKNSSGKETGKVIIKEADWTGAPHFFNIADTQFFKDAVSAAESGGARTATLLSYVAKDNGETDWEHINVTYDNNTQTAGLSISPNAFSAGRESALVTSITHGPEWSSLSDITYNVTAKSVTGKFTLTTKHGDTALDQFKNQAFTIPASAAFDAGVKTAVVDTDYKTISISNSHYTESEYFLGDEHHYVKVNIDARAKGTYADGTTYYSSAQPIASDYKILADDVYNAGVTYGKSQGSGAAYDIPINSMVGSIEQYPYVEGWTSNDEKALIKISFKIDGKDKSVNDDIDVSRIYRAGVEYGKTQAGGVVINSTSVSRSTSNYNPYQKYMSGSTKWVIDTYPVINGSTYGSAVALDVQDLYNAWHTDVGTWATPEIIPYDGVIDLQNPTDETIVFADSDVFYYAGYDVIQGVVKISHGSYTRKYFISMDASQKSSGGSETVSDRTVESFGFNGGSSNGWAYVNAYFTSGDPQSNIQLPLIADEDGNWYTIYNYGRKVGREEAGGGESTIVYSNYGYTLLSEAWHTVQGRPACKVSWVVFDGDNNVLDSGSEDYVRPY